MYTVWPMVLFASSFIWEETEQVSLSAISRGSAATPTVAVSFALGDLKSCFKMETVDHDRHIITYEHTHSSENSQVFETTFKVDSSHAHIHAHMQTHKHSFIWLKLTASSNIPAICELLGSRVKGEGFKLNAKTPEVYTSSELHWPEKLFINTWPGWTECPCKRRKGDVLCVNKTFWNCQIQTDTPGF